MTLKQFLRLDDEVVSLVSVRVKLCRIAMYKGRSKTFSVTQKKKKKRAKTEHFYCGNILPLLIEKLI